MLNPIFRLLRLIPRRGYEAHAHTYVFFLFCGIELALCIFLQFALKHKVVLEVVLNVAPAYLDFVFVILLLLLLLPRRRNSVYSRLFAG